MTLPIVIVGLLLMLFWVITLSDAFESKFKDSDMKVVWILVIIFTKPFGAIFYWIIAPKQKVNNFKPVN